MLHIPIGEDLMKLFFYIGPFVRVHVPITIDDWWWISDDLKYVLWSSIKMLERKY